MSNLDTRALIAADLHSCGLVEAVFSAISAAPGALGGIGYRKLKRRLKSRAEARFEMLATALGPDDYALDLGANVGDLTAVMAASGAQVTAYEPEPETFALLKERFSDAANVTLQQAAVSDRSGKAELILPASFKDIPHSASKAASIAHERYRGEGAQTVQVAVCDIRQVLADCKKPPKLIKMDIEGAELDVLDALRGSNLLDANTAVFVETHERLDPASLPRVKALQEWARSQASAYVNLYWG